MSYPLEESEFAEAVRRELESARSKFGPIHSLHEGYAVILEEQDELWDEARKKRADRNADAILGELVQIAAMAQRTAEDLGLIPRPDLSPEEQASERQFLRPLNPDPITALSRRKR